MQSIGNGVESLFVADTGGGGERNLNTAHHQLFGDGLGTSLKCPRCGSLNTKFCYYNNYNLSQPRFLCKGCRRYWTKGGVLRNVPVGGSTRKTKTKRSNKKSERKSTDSHNSSSDSSSIVAANISPETTPFTLTESLPKTSVNQSFEPTRLNDNVHQVFSEMGTFRSLMTASSDELTVGFQSAQEASQLKQREQDPIVENQDWGQKQWVQATDGVMDSLVLEDHRSHSSHGGDAAEDWGLFDQSYWLNNPDHQLNYLL